MSLSRPPAAASNPQMAGLIREAANHGKDLMDGLLRKTRDALQSQIDQTRDADARDAKAMVVSSLMQSGPELRARFPEVLTQTFMDELCDSPATTTLDSGPSSIKFDQLELMDEQEVQTRISATRGLQQALMEAEHELTELNALVSGILGLDQVRPERNPFRPEVFVTALQTLLGEMQGGTAARAQCSHIMAPLLGKALRPVYLDLLAFLRSQKVQPVRYAIQRPVGGGGTALPASIGGGFVSAGGPHAGGPAGLSGGRSSGVAASRGVPLSLMPAGAQGLAPSAMAQHGQLTVQQLRGLVTGMAKGTEPLVHEVVNLIIANILGDERLLPPVRQALAGLEPALMRVARADQHFFSDKQHPSRLLLEEISQHSFAFEHETSEGFADFLLHVRQALASIDPALADTGAFVKALARLRARWHQEEERRAARQKAAVRALQHAERRNELAKQLADHIRQQEGTALVPDVVVDFACGPWAQVMAQAQLEGKVDRPGEPDYVALLEDLFWSVRPDQARKQPAQLARLIPELIKGLRRGLASIHCPEDQTEAFFSQLFGLHQGGLEGKSARSPRPAPAAQRTWLAPEEARDSGFMDDLGGAPDGGAAAARVSDFPATEPMSLEARDAETGQAPLASDEPAASLPDQLALEGLQPGSWIELLVDGHWVRLQLVWVNEQATLCLFSRGNGSNHSMTRRMFDRLAAQGHLRLVAQGAVVDRAFDAVAELAMRNSVYMDIQDDPRS